MAFLVTARKYRPASFQEVVAQQHVIHTLLNAVRMERVAHAYLFSGPRGVGKTTTARIFAKALNCRNSVDGEPCNTCTTCVEIAEGRCIDIIEIDGASNNGVEEARNIREAVRYMPAREKYKMYIIDEVHMLTKPAFNALLKTLEEPPAHAIFILATTEAHRLPLTIISRCQQFEFRRIHVNDIVGQLGGICRIEGIDADDDALHAIARKADGSMRDAESIFDQVVAFAGDRLTFDTVREVLHLVDTELYFRVTDIILAHDGKAAFALVDEVIRNGHDLQEFLLGLEEHFRNLLVALTTGETVIIEESEDVRNRYLEVSQKFTDGDLLRLLHLTTDAVQAVRFSAMPRVRLESAILAMTKLDSTVLLSELLERLKGGRISGAATGGTAPMHTIPSAHHTAMHRPPVSAPAMQASLPGARKEPPPTVLKQHDTQFTAEPPAGLGQISTGKTAQRGTTASASTNQPAPPKIVQMLIDTMGAEIIQPK
jgi:DNA polymerase-3 subunit gamma/tau